MKEHIERVETIFSELGFDIFDKENTESMYEASFGKNGDLIGSFFLEKESNFLELANSYVFNKEDETFLKEHLETMMNICYDYGNYFNITKDDGEINFSIFSKLYLSGLNVESLQDTLEDFIECNQELVSIFDEGDEENYQDSDGLSSLNED